MLFLNYSRAIDPFLRDIRIFASEFTGIRKGDKVLDVCCGTGDQVFYYSAKGAEAYGIDLDPKMINQARNDKRNKIFKNTSFQIADAIKLPFEGGFFDCVSISFGLHEKEREVRDEIISEMERVVKKEGALIFIDFQVPFPGNFFSYFIKFVERIAGGNHFKYFKDYIKQGGLDKLLSKNHLKEEKRALLVKNNVLIIRAKR